MAYRYMRGLPISAHYRISAQHVGPIEGWAHLSVERYPELEALAFRFAPAWEASGAGVAFPPPVGMACVVQ